MKLAVVLVCACAGGAIADPHHAIDVDEMARNDCALVRAPAVEALARCDRWRCGEFVQLGDVCQLCWSEPAPPLTTTLRESHLLRRHPRSFIVEILRTAEQLVD